MDGRNYEFYDKPVTALVPPMEYMGLVAIQRQSTGEGEIHLTLRVDPEKSWAASTRTLSLVQAVRLKAELEMAITALRDNGIQVPAPVPPYKPG